MIRGTSIDQVPLLPCKSFRLNTRTGIYHRGKKGLDVDIMDDTQ